jgi:hypothetical protein
LQITINLIWAELLRLNGELGGYFEIIERGIVGVQVISKSISSKCLLFGGVPRMATLIYKKARTSQTEIMLISIERIITNPSFGFKKFKIKRL